eukprot:8497745-Ditylum_brightwellii.AAC.1
MAAAIGVLSDSVMMDMVSFWDLEAILFMLASREKMLPSRNRCNIRVGNKVTRQWKGTMDVRGLFQSSWECGVWLRIVAFSRL